MLPRDGRFALGSYVARRLHHLSKPTHAVVFGEAEQAYSWLIAWLAEPVVCPYLAYIVKCDLVGEGLCDAPLDDLLQDGCKVVIVAEGVAPHLGAAEDHAALCRVRKLAEELDATESSEGSG